MPETPELTASELASLLIEREPSALLVPGPILRRVIRHDCGFMGLPLQVPHKKTYLIAGDVLLRAATAKELGVEGGALPAHVLLLVRPSDEHLRDTPREQVLLEYWRLLFHGRVHAVLEERWAKGDLTIRGIQEWIRTVGDTEFREACAVLRDESLLLPPDDVRHAYVEFVAVYLELRFFAGTLLPSYFPSLRDHDELSARLAGEVDAKRLYDATRPRGAPEPRPPAETTSEEPIAHFHDLMKEADEAAGAGNVVRAAILRTRASRVAPAAETAPTILAAHKDLDQLVARLLVVLGAGREAEARWRTVLRELLDKSDHGYWPPEALLLHDLQNACVHGERDVYSISLFRWATGGSLKEQLPDQRDLQICKHLTRAVHRLPTVRLTVGAREELQRLLHQTVKEVEGRLRRRLRPLIEDALRSSGLVPSSYPETVVLAKVVDELLDRIALRWFLTFSDVRDAVSSNQLKLPDLDSAGTLVGGDTLLRIDRELHASLVGTYRPAEIYRSWFQRLSAVFAATSAGRALVWNVFLPIGGAFVARIGAEHLYDLSASLGHRLHAVAPSEPADTPQTLVSDLAPLIQVGAIAVVLALLVNVAPVRRLAFTVLRYVGFVVRGLVFELPLALARVPFIRRFLENDLALAFVRYVLRPAGLTAAVAVGFSAASLPLNVFPGWALVFLSSALLLNSRLWRVVVEENLEDSMLRSWRFIAMEALPGLLRGVLAFFKGLSEGLEAFVYAVDQWLRYRTGEGRGTLALKAVLGPVWAPVNWFLRFLFDVAIEPRLNPVKYVSVVMVLDKFELSVMGPLHAFWKGVFAGIGPVGANTLAVFMLYAMTDAAGFLVWEFKENWRLYRANRSPALEPQALSHGSETLPRLLMGGGHGARSRLARIFGKLRHAERQAHRTGSWAESRKQRAALEEIRDSVAEFVRRGFLGLLGSSKAFAETALALRDVRLGLNQVTLELEWSRAPGKRLLVAFEAESGWLVASIMDAGFLPDLSLEQRAAFKTALVGLYKSSGVELVKEQVALYLASFTALGLVFDVTREGLKVWPKDQLEASAVYDLALDGVVKPHPLFVPTPLALPPLEARRLMFVHTDVGWDEWLLAWTEEESGRPPALAERVPFPLVPEAAPPPVTRRMDRRALVEAIQPAPAENR